MLITDIQPIDYPDVVSAAVYNWKYLLTFLLPAAVYVIPAIARWRYLLWLTPLAFAASCTGFFIYWRSIDYALMEYYQKTGYFNAADTWYSLMPFVYGLPSSLVATLGCTLIAWAFPRWPRYFRPN